MIDEFFFNFIIQTVQQTEILIVKFNYHTTLISKANGQITK
jgi:hypothetical protein